MVCEKKQCETPYEQREHAFNLQREAKLETKREEEELRASLLRLGFPLMPRIKVRYRAIAKQPPVEWKNRMTEKFSRNPRCEPGKTTGVWACAESDD